ncbi:MAG: glycosyltransferase family 4 protein [Candidatus Dormibacteria bacterium]
MFTPENLEVLLVSFEGPDEYSQAGGLGVRMTDMSRALAALGFRTTLAFVGSPGEPADEERDGVRLIRWCQELSRRSPGGVYDGQEAKIRELCVSLPDHLIDRVVRPAVGAGRVVAILFEEWQLADVCHLMTARLTQARLRQSCMLLWNANNFFGFGEIDWAALGRAAAITTVSRYMKQLMRAHGVNPIVIPNGIAVSALQPVDGGAVEEIRQASGTPCLAFKIGRFSRDKCWHQAVSAIARLRADGVPARLLMRGDRGPFGAEVVRHATTLGLEVAEWERPIADCHGIAQALRDSGTAPVVNLRIFLPAPVIPEIAAAATAVLANSGHEPFGLVGLETMAAGGVAVVGSTGEEYARPYGNAVVIETDDAAELASALLGLVERPELSRRLREAARRDASDFVWSQVIEGLMERLRYVCTQQGVTAPAAAP